MSDFNPELWGLRIRYAAGLPCPPPEPCLFFLGTSIAEWCRAWHVVQTRSDCVELKQRFS